MSETLTAEELDRVEDAIATCGYGAAEGRVPDLIAQARRCAEAERRCRDLAARFRVNASTLEGIMCASIDKEINAAYGGAARAWATAADILERECHGREKEAADDGS